MFGEIIDKKRKQKQMTKRELAKKSGLTPQYVGLLIDNKRGSRIGAQAALGLEKALGLTPGFFLKHRATNVDKQSRKVV